MSEMDLNFPIKREAPFANGHPAFTMRSFNAWRRDHSRAQVIRF